MEVYEKLRIARKASGLSQSYVASILGTTQQQYAKYESGKHAIPLERFAVLCRVFNLSADEVLELKERSFFFY